MTDYLSTSWCGLDWSPWARHTHSKTEFAVLPDEPGLYRVRAIDADSLMYIGQTGRSVRQRQRDLRVYLRNPELMPFNDPHTAAPNFWAWTDATGMEFESSGAVFYGTKQEREGLETYLLWQYRLERGTSTQCNFGRFHEDYVQSRNHSTGIRGGKLPGGTKNPAGGLSLPPLQSYGRPAGPDWMELPWEEPLPLQPDSIKSIKNTASLYRILDTKCKDVLYIGQTRTAKTRLNAHAKRNRGEKCFFSICFEDSAILPHQLKELENDLIGAYYAEKGRIPVFQIGGK
ncbi:MAG: GIY-YIG nuclease family protein [Euryarchaeota archaeon]|nr:GIY-YIG nuclease family protein [Euryarchaeota archaeon]